MTTTYCNRCGMTFRVEDRPRAEAARCPESGCGRPFWTAKKGGSLPDQTGMAPDRYARWIAGEPCA